MKRLMSLVLIGAILGTISCKKEMEGTVKSISQDSLTVGSSMNSASASIKYGVLVNGLNGEKRITVTDKLQVGYVRDQVILTGFNGKAPLLDKYQKKGYKILLNLINSSDGGKPVPF